MPLALLIITVTGPSLSFCVLGGCIWLACGVTCDTFGCYQLLSKFCLRSTHYDICLRRLLVEGKRCGRSVIGVGELLEDSGEWEVVGHCRRVYMVREKSISCSDPEVSITEL